MKLEKASILVFLVLFTSIFSCRNEREGNDAANDSTIETDSIQEPEDFTISPNSFYGITIGIALDSVNNKLKKGMLRTGEGNFETYRIISRNGDTLGYVMPSPLDETIVRDIHITTPQAETETGLSVGDTFEDILFLWPDIDVHGSELESRVYAIIDNYSFLLDTYSNQYNLDKATIELETKIKEIIIRDFKDKI